MRELYRKVCLSKKEFRFFSTCSICGKARYGSKIHWLCRDPDISQKVTDGRAGKLRQYLYNKSKASSVQELALSFNLCRSCGEWVCDECFHPEIKGGICFKCKETKTK